MTKQSILKSFQAVRQQTEKLCQPLETEDYVIQSIDDVSPPKWHLAHTSWFFETFVLNIYSSSFKQFHSSFHYLFNSYYQGIGKPYPRPQRGLLSRPTAKTIYAYRQYINEHIVNLIEKFPDDQFTAFESLLILGLHHEQQHQELLLMDIKHNFAIDPNFPIYNELDKSFSIDNNNKIIFIELEGGLVDIGYQESYFCFDNELPTHKTFLLPYALANRPITNADYLAFIADNGYQDPRLWLADGWDYLKKNKIDAPLYWHNLDGEWHIFTLNGLKPLCPTEPVTHVSYYEADAYARWCSARLPSEQEWEHFVKVNQLTPDHANSLENNVFHPQTNLKKDSLPHQFYGDVWEWTQSSYSPYPGYKPLKGSLGEYNGKFMSNQIVLRGGSCVTPAAQLRASYRNFFQPEKRWLFSGIRLAKTI